MRFFGKTVWVEMIYQKWCGGSGVHWNGFGKNRAAMETGGVGHHGGLALPRPALGRVVRAGMGEKGAWGDWLMLQSGLIRRAIRTMVFGMVTLAEIETLAFRLPESARAKLAADLLDSLPGVLVEDDEGLAEALRRSEEMDRDPSVCLTHDEFLKAVGRPA